MISLYHLNIVMDYTMLDTLNESSYRWMIRVRVCFRMWESINPHNEKKISLDMILIDEKISKIYDLYVCQNCIILMIYLCLMLMFIVDV